MAEREALTAEYVRSILDYNPETGVFTWRWRSDAQTRWNTHYAEQVAGSKNSNGYIIIHIGDRRYRAHRLAWLIATNAWPKNLIDHIDMDRSNNRLSNLREATHSQNKANRCKPSHNKSGYKGVSWSRTTNKWLAQIVVDGRPIPLGRFDDVEEAAMAYAKAAREIYGEFSRIE
jgi:hypothetical protein